MKTNEKEATAQVSTSNQHVSEALAKSTPIDKRIERQIEKTNNMLQRISLMYDRLKKIEVRNLFREMPKVLNSYKREYGKIKIDIQHINGKGPAEVKNFDEASVKNDSTKIGKQLLVLIKSVKNNSVIGILNYTLSPRFFSRLKREEKLVIARKNKLENKRNKLLSKLDNPPVATTATIAEPDADVKTLMKILRKSNEGKKYLKGIRKPKEYLAKMVEGEKAPTPVVA